MNRNKYASFSTPGANFHPFTTLTDPNPISDVGCPQSSGFMLSVVTLCMPLDIYFRLDTLDSEPFYHGDSKSCSESHLTIGICNLSVTYIHVPSASIPFHTTDGDSFLLLSNKIQHSYHLRLHNLILIPPGVRNFSTVEVIRENFLE